MRGLDVWFCEVDSRWAREWRFGRLVVRVRVVGWSMLRLLSSLVGFWEERSVSVPALLAVEILRLVRLLWRLGLSVESMMG